MSINLRKELEILLRDHYEFMIIRNMTETECGCMNFRKASNIADPQCLNCEGTGYVFEEHLVRTKLFYSSARNSHLHDFGYGQGYGNAIYAYLVATDFNLRFKKGDIVFKIETELDGRLKNPIVRTEKWPIIDNIILKLDDSKVEFIKLYLKPNIV